MAQFEWKPRKKELRLPYKYGDFLIQFERDSHNRKWIIFSPNLPEQKVPYILTEGEGDTVIEFLDKIRKTINKFEMHQDALEESEGTPWFYDNQDHRWKIGLIYDPSLGNYSNELYDRIDEQFKDLQEYGLQRFKPFFVMTKLRK
jgi:hypothetical protein